MIFYFFFTNIYFNGKIYIIQLLFIPRFNSAVHGIIANCDVADITISKYVMRILLRNRILPNYYITNESSKHRQKTKCTQKVMNMHKRQLEKYTSSYILVRKTMHSLFFFFSICMHIQRHQKLFYQRHRAATRSHLARLNDVYIYIIYARLSSQLMCPTPTAIRAFRSFCFPSSSRLIHF